MFDSVELLETLTLAISSFVVEAKMCAMNVVISTQNTISTNYARNTGSFSFSGGGILARANELTNCRLHRALACTLP